ncbi:MAG: Nucleoside diphosphate kinase [Candidatus Anoxychlamydiales bacterium]|nr:Nucleoside diphosphate kinase [Candidatus Anoxychlamydiales bacterium]NGX36021.1 Nucleoside diphosphate kinase [Candidatus Anoxychlamydiales bacterium]
MQQTLSIIKPDAIEKNVIGEILKHFEKNNLKIVAAKMLHLTKERAEKFYLIHKDKPFYNDLVDFMTSGSILVSVLYGEDAVKKNRDIMGATNPEQADKGTIRKDFATNIEKNAVHGSDSLENAKIEIAFFFKEDEIFIR